MSIFADAARVITNLADFGSQFIGLDANLTPPTSDSDGDSEYFKASMTGMAGGLGNSLNSRQVITGIAKVGGKLTVLDRDFITKKCTVDPPEWRAWLHDKFVYQPGDKARIARYGQLGPDGKTYLYKSNTGATVNILPWTASVVGYLELLTGFGPPNEGTDLKSGAELWGALQQQLESAMPTEDWEGGASDAYAAQVAALRDIAKNLADLDGRLADIIADQAEWVTHIRLGFGILLSTVTAAIGIEILLRIALISVPGGPAIAIGWAILASTLAIGAALGLLGTLIRRSVENGNEADDVTSEMERLGAAAAQLVNGSTAESVVATAPESRVSEFQTLSNGPSPTLAAPSVQKPTSRKAAARESDGAEADTPEIPENLQGGSQSAAMPTLGALLQMSNPAGSKSGQSSRYGRRPEPMTNAPAAGVVETPGAGSDAAGRAPVDVAGGTEQTPDKATSLRHLD